MDKVSLLAKITESKTVILSFLTTAGLTSQQLNKANKDTQKTFEDLEKKLLKLDKKKP